MAVGGGRTGRGGWGRRGGVAAGVAAGLAVGLTASPWCTAMIRCPTVITLAAASAHRPMGRMYGTPRPDRPTAVNVSTSRSDRSAIPTFAVVPRPSARALTYDTSAPATRQKSDRPASSWL